MNNEQKVIAFFIGELQQGGAERVIVNLANYWANNNLKLLIITIDGKAPFYELDTRVDHVKLRLNEDSSGSVLKGVKFNIERILKLRNILRLKKVNILISFITDTNLIALVSSLGLGLKVIVSDRTSPYAEKDFTHPFKLYLKKKLYHFADYVVVQTISVSRYYHRWLPRAKVVVINNPLPTDFKASFSNSFVKKPLIVAVGRLQKEKNFELLINAFSSIEMKMWSLVIVGEGKDRGSLTELIKRNKAENSIYLVGSSSNVKEWYKQASIFVLSSEFEGYPNVLIEAMAMGLPVVSTNCDFGPAEIIEDGINGMLVPNKNVLALTNKLVELMNNEELRNRLSFNSSKIINKLNINIIAKEWETLF
jgi:GalNAc-alpha-(1->4)-GalNAc-alpha-(1->3)-diNAcBac-PP-undecaprenol alpha-1,4-N-acetyl-D-galactosaminyltransferase